MGRLAEDSRGQADCEDTDLVHSEGKPPLNKFRRERKPVHLKNINKY